MLRIILDCDDVLYRTNEAALDRLNKELELHMYWRISRNGALFHRNWIRE